MSEPKVPARSDVDLERSVLGAVIALDASAIVSARLRPEDFAHPAHGEIWRALLDASQHGQLTVELVAQALTRRRRINTVGGREYLRSLLDYAPTSLQALSPLVDELAGSAMARRVELACVRINALALDRTVPPPEMERRVLEEIASATLRMDTGEAGPLGDALEEFWSLYDAPDSSLSTGFRDLDEAIGGLRAPQLIVLAARPAMGKTGVLGAISLAVARANKRVLFWSLEMARVEITRRILASESGVPVTDVLKKRLTSEQFAALTEQTNRLFSLGLNLSIIDRSANVDDIVAGSMREHGRAPLSLIVIDHLHKVSHTGRSESEERHLSEVTEKSKQLAKKLGVPVLLLCQLNRDCEKRENKRPQLSDLRGSGAIEQDADVVLGLYRDEYYNPQSKDRGFAELGVLKQRDGSGGVVRLRFHGDTVRFTSVEHSDAPREYAPQSDGYPDDDAVSY